MCKVNRSCKTVKKQTKHQQQNFLHSFTICHKNTGEFFVTYINQTLWFAQC